MIGSGRWARTIAQALYCLPGRDHQILMFSRSGAKVLSDWIDAHGMGSRISAMPGWPDFNDRSRFLAAIIANRASDHFAAASSSLSAGVPTFVEKPAAITEEQVQALAKLAVHNETMLAVSHVFLFARYVDAFVSLVHASGTIKAVEIVWSDPFRDVRDGEFKTYDASLPVVDDVLPHVIPLAMRLGIEELRPETVAVSRGGAYVDIQMGTDLPVACRILLERDGLARQRSVKVETENGAFVLDFAQEPGVITTPHRHIGGDPDWTWNVRPLGRMIDVFLHSVSENSPDPRLSPDHAINAARVADLVRPLYIRQQNEWLENLAAIDLEGTAYALRERGK
jgi:predicted dehydrogenase